MIRSGNDKTKNGFLIVEVLVAVGIMAALSVAIFGVTTVYLKSSTSVRETMQANMLGQETMEAIRSFRDSILWNNDDAQNQYDGLGVVATGVNYHAEKSGDNPPKWMLVQGNETVGEFTRRAVFENVQRDGNNIITQSGGTADPDTKKVTVAVSWKNKNVELITYLTNWKR